MKSAGFGCFHAATTPCRCYATSPGVACSTQAHLTPHRSAAACHPVQVLASRTPPKLARPDRDAFRLTMLARHRWLPAASGPQQEEERVARSRQRRNEAKDPSDSDSPTPRTRVLEFGISAALKAGGCTMLSSRHTSSCVSTPARSSASQFGCLVAGITFLASCTHVAPALCVTYILTSSLSSEGQRVM